MKLEHDVDTLLDLIEQECKKRQRSIVAIAGLPASGKSTLARAVVDGLNAMHPDEGFAALLPMDGFHLDNGLLVARGLLERKGAPETFDADGFHVLLQRVRDATGDVLHPIFDRSREMSINAAGVITVGARVVVVEGNYLLLATEPWRSARALYDLTLFLNTPIEEIERRLIDRWLTYGFDLASARSKVHNNDLLNARLVLEQSVSPDFEFAEDGSAEAAITVQP